MRSRSASESMDHSRVGIEAHPRTGGKERRRVLHFGQAGDAELERDRADVADDAAAFTNQTGRLENAERVLRMAARHDENFALSDVETLAGIRHHADVAGDAA